MVLPLQTIRLLYLSLPDFECPVSRTASRRWRRGLLEAVRVDCAECPCRDHQRRVSIDGNGMVELGRDGDGLAVDSCASGLSSELVTPIMVAPLIRAFRGSCPDNFNAAAVRRAMITDPRGIVVKCRSSLASCVSTGRPRPEAVNWRPRWRANWLMPVRKMSPPDWTMELLRWSASGLARARYRSCGSLAVRSMSCRK